MLSYSLQVMIQFFDQLQEPCDENLHLLLLTTGCLVALEPLSNAKLSWKGPGAALHPICKYQNPKRHHPPPLPPECKIDVWISQLPSRHRHGVLVEKAAFPLFIDWIHR